MNVDKTTFEQAVRIIQKAGIQATTPPAMTCQSAEQRRTLAAVAKAYGTTVTFDTGEAFT